MAVRNAKPKGPRPAPPPAPPAPSRLADPLAGSPSVGRPGEAALNAGMSAVGGDAVPIFSAAEVEQLSYRRFNPFARLTPERLAQALDSYEIGDPRSAAQLWAAMLRRDTTLATIREKRNEAVALRDWTVVPADDTPAAADQAAALTWFYKNLVAGDSLNIHATGGMAKLFTQMMDCVPFGFAVHHLLFQPDAAESFKLPSGRVVPALRARFEQVPLEFFEFRTGELRFLGLDQAYNGAPLVPGAWMITTGPALMMAVSFKQFAKRLAEQDWINYCQRFGTPGVMLHTTAQKGTPEGQAAEMAARELGSNFRGVAYQAAENKAEFLSPSGSSGSGTLPMAALIEEIKRELTSLFLGADLSTMSRGGASRGVGASLQADEQEKRERADCERISETCNAQVDPTVIRWFFGQGAPILAKFALESPINEDRALLGDLVAQMVGLGAQVPVAETARRLQVPLAKAGEDVLQKPVAPATPTPDNGIAINADPGAVETANKLQVAAGRRYAAAKLKTMEPLSARLADLEAIENPVIRHAATVKFLADVPRLLGEINHQPANAPVVADSTSASLFNGLIEGAVETHGSTDAPPNP